MFYSISQSVFIAQSLPASILHASVALVSAGQVRAGFYRGIPPLPVLYSVLLETTRQPEVTHLATPRQTRYAQSRGGGNLTSARGYLPLRAPRASSTAHPALPCPLAVQTWWSTPRVRAWGEGFDPPAPAPAPAPPTLWVGSSLRSGATVCRFFPFFDLPLSWTDLAHVSLNSTAFNRGCHHRAPPSIVYHLPPPPPSCRSRSLTRTPCVTLSWQCTQLKLKPSSQMKLKPSSQLHLLQLLLTGCEMVAAVTLPTFNR
eukprot:COSAG02_NODE_1588_length_11795_cov_1295.418348_12_plen_258_part_00